MAKKKEAYVPTVGEEIGNAVSHGVMSLLSLAALPFAAVWAYAHDSDGVLASVSVSVFVISIFLMFLASTLYHSMNPQSKHKDVFHILDHIFIYVAIAGSYTPFTLILLDGTWKGPVICGVVWAAALLGVTLNAVSVERFEKFSMLLYIAMGWAVVFAVGDVVRALPSAGFWLLLLGGVSYTGGIVFYAWHKKGRVHYMHGVWHLFVLLGSVLHYLCILLYVLPRAYA